MATNWGGAASGAASGAAMGSMILPGWGTAIGAVGGGLMGLFGGGDETDLQDARTEEQKRAAKALLQLAETGSYGNINLGEGYTGSLGSYDTTGQSAAYKQLIDLYGGSDLQTSSNTLQKLTDLKFNPDDPSSGYAAFSRQLAKAGKESDDILNREAAISGNRFGTSILGQKADLAADLANQRGMYLAQLYQNQQNNALNAAEGLRGVAATKGLIAESASQQAAVINAIKDQEANDMYNEYKRQRNETLSRIDLLQTEANRNPYLGVDTSGTSASPFSSLVNSALGSLGSNMGTNLGGAISNLFNKAGTASTASNGTASFISSLYGGK